MQRRTKHGTIMTTTTIAKGIASQNQLLLQLTPLEHARSMRPEAIATCYLLTRPRQR